MSEEMMMVSVVVFAIFGIACIGMAVVNLLRVDFDALFLTKERYCRKKGEEWLEARGVPEEEWDGYWERLQDRETQRREILRGGRWPRYPDGGFE